MRVVHGDQEQLEHWIENEWKGRYSRGKTVDMRAACFEEISFSLNWSLFKNNNNDLITSLWQKQKETNLSSWCQLMSESWRLSKQVWLWYKISTYTSTHPGSISLPRGGVSKLTWKPGTKPSFNWQAYCVKMLTECYSYIMAFQKDMPMGGAYGRRKRKLSRESNFPTGLGLAEKICFDIYKALWFLPTGCRIWVL